MKAEEDVTAAAKIDRAQSRQNLDCSLTAEMDTKLLHERLAARWERELTALQLAIERQDPQLLLKLDRIVAFSSTIW